ncbi:hypothetical protein Acr_05g0008080 [Actinidia rufa]|uniref:Uncharacterized protein n=1 Tax=Actinidia rufa TaxID=165716 RepID=A0A7J0EMF7_9ERIC|nr:hypothetical protein Acr_05g0008080 [Actinidia rufa]
MCRSSVETLPNASTVRAKATIIFWLSLFSKLGGVTALEFGRGAMHCIRETRKKTSYAPKTPGSKRAELLDDAQRTAKATSRLMKPAQAVEVGPFEEKTKESNPHLGRVKIEGSADPALACTTRAIVNLLRRASGEYYPTELPPVPISARFSTPSVTEEEIYAISLIVELPQHRQKHYPDKVNDSHDQARAKRTHPEVPDAFLQRHQEKGPVRKIYATKVYTV